MQSSSNHRGNGLVATRQIRKGEVIFTERAVVVTQLPPICIVCQNNKEASAWSSVSIRACQNCFRSLEPISTLSSPGIVLPLTQLWPVPEYHDGSERHGYRVDAHGRLQCTECNALFCSHQCKDAHGNEMGSCCDCSSAVNAVVHAMHSPHSSSGDDVRGSDQENLELQPAVIMAVRMYCSLLHRYRSVGKLGLGRYEGLCGDVDDVTPLELGCEEVVDSSNSKTQYTLRSAYDAMCKALDVTMEDRHVLALELFHHLAAISARNGFAVTPQLPFRAYYAALLRAAGGRDTDCHKDIMRQVAMALGSKDGTLNRGMDRQVEEKVRYIGKPPHFFYVCLLYISSTKLYHFTLSIQCAVQVVALFSLTARINHSCDPCAEVRNQEFVDCHIDLVAKRDILCGEEITISYINLGRMAGKVATDRHRRIRELQAKYLFTCDCVRCRNNL